ncbi:hypothetical protein K502DRAFT_226665 [Neoconidiobolus thromboides FSU 785]|nr:hypothetical protein K502DRAFT_226665 [Neoconidiobolus thromboides FSU 785]
MKLALVGYFNYLLDLFIPLDSEHFSEGSNLKIGTNSFEPLITPLGSLKLSVTSRINCNFYKEDGEKLLSAKFQDLDARISNIKEDSFSPQKAFTHRRFSSHGDILNKSPLTYNPESSLQPQIVKSPDDLGDSPVSSSTSADSSNINRSSNSDIQVNNLKQKFSSNKDILSKNYDSKSLPRGSSGKNIPIFASMRSSPPSHVTSALRRPPSLSSFSPFKSPSLSSSPSLHNISPPSKNSSFGNRSVTSLERGIHLSTAKATPITVRPSSPAPSKLSSSFGHRFGSISENPNSQDYVPSPSSLSRRNLSIRNSGFFERNSASSGANTTSLSVSLILQIVDNL